VVVVRPWAGQETLSFDVLCTAAALGLAVNQTIVLPAASQAWSPELHLTLLGRCARPPSLTHPAGRSARQD
jgi:hypothetical protein